MFSLEVNFYKISGDARWERYRPQWRRRDGKIRSNKAGGGKIHDVLRVCSSYGLRSVLPLINEAKVTKALLHFKALGCFFLKSLWHESLKFNLFCETRYRIQVSFSEKKTFRMKHWLPVLFGQIHVRFIPTGLKCPPTCTEVKGHSYSDITNTLF